MDTEARTYRTGSEEAVLDLTRDAAAYAAGRGALLLGTWQSICLVDLNVDNPEREVRFSFVAG